MGCKRKHLPQPQPPQPAAKNTEVSAAYHQTMEEFISSGCETPELFLYTLP